MGAPEFTIGVERTSNGRRLTKGIFGRSSVWDNDCFIQFKPRHDIQPRICHERSCTQHLKPGELLGCRILRVGDHFQMSGSAYLFTLLTGPRVLSLVREHGQGFGQQLDAPRQAGLLIMREWLQHWLKPAP
jgi:hypothetical protein